MSGTLSTRPLREGRALRKVQNTINPVITVLYTRNEEGDRILLQTLGGFCETESQVDRSEDKYLAPIAPLRPRILIVNGEIGQERAGMTTGSEIRHDPKRPRGHVTYGARIRYGDVYE